MRREPGARDATAAAGAPRRRPTPPIPSAARSGELAKQAAGLRPDDAPFAIGDTTLLELEKAAQPKTPPPTPRTTGSALTSAAPLEPARAMASPPAQSLPMMLATAIPYVFDVVKSRRSLQGQRTRMMADQSGDEQLLATAYAEIGAAVRKADLRDPGLEPVFASIAAAEKRRDQAAGASGA